MRLKFRSVKKSSSMTFDSATLKSTGKTAIIILAGGDGRRIGGSKHDKRLNGKPLLEYTMERAALYGDNIAIQLAYENQIDSVDIPQIIDEPDINGPLGGVIAALKWCKIHGYDSMLTLPCDCPFLPDDLLTRLSTAANGSDSIAMPVSHESLHPVCSLWQTSHLMQLQNNADKGQLSLKRNALDCGIIKVEWDTQTYDPFFNVNTLDELKEAEQILKRL